MACIKNSKNVCCGLSWCVCGLIRVLGCFYGFYACSQNRKKWLLALSCPSVLPPLRVVHLNCHWTDFHELSYLSTFRKSVEKIQVSLKLDKNNRHFTYRPIYIFDHILLSSSYNEKCFKGCSEIQNTHFMFSNLF